MSRKLLAGTFTAVPVRVHVYPSRSAHMFVDEAGQGCWSDPEGKVLLFSMADARRVAEAHGYTVVDDSNAVVPIKAVIDPAVVPGPHNDLLEGEGEEGASAAEPGVVVVQPVGVLTPGVVPTEPYSPPQEGETPPAVGESFAVLEEAPQVGADGEGEGEGEGEGDGTGLGAATGEATPPFPSPVLPAATQPVMEPATVSRKKKER